MTKLSFPPSPLTYQSPYKNATYIIAITLTKANACETPGSAENLIGLT